MTTAPVPAAPALGPLTVRAFLLGPQPGESAEALADSLHEHDAATGVLPRVRGLTDAADRAVEHELANVIDGFLDLDLLSLLAHGWSKHSALRDAAHRTRRFPGSEEVVALATHSITSTHHPYVDVLVDGAPAATVDVALDVAFRIRALVAVVREARLTGVRSGECEVEATLAVRGITVATRQGRLDLPATLRLRSPIDLLPAREPPP
ncbi:hypothetical protein [Streptomyces bambusae]|uniref:Uncharacterized protein n=1 Tax=Streptomyces bambusae TaxID=1550616 RepID=A0ABS6Z620_9ACTN|nr:hypothetical protein [Streptomyces bambusae]MBW5483210.1 hypothetical protein [Streptomyces bambusae]